MDFVAFEYDRPFVLEGLRHGEIDYLEHVSEAAEADLFRHLIGRDVLTRLAENYPTPRKKEEVPVWLYLASQISLKLHDASYHAFPYVLRSGGLITALGPQVGRKALHPDTQDVTLACEGFNDKNTNGRQTPCDQDFLRKLARDTDASRLHDWFNREVPRCLRSLKLFDPEGLFVGDASYLFVPDNENYEDSVKLLFDEHNHPVESKEVDRSDKRYQWRRCYKVVSLLHVNRSLDLFLTVAARVVPGNRHECPILYELVDGLVKAVDRGWMQTLLGMARGVTSWTECPVPLSVVINRERDKDGQMEDWVLATTSSSFRAEQIRSNYMLRTTIEERHRQYKCFWDLARMPSRKFSLVVNQVLFVLLAYTLLQGHLFLRKRQEMNPRTRGRLLQFLNPRSEE